MMRLTMCSCLWLALLIFAGAAGTAGTFGQEPEPAAQVAPVAMGWKFEKGKPFYQTMTTNTRQRMVVQSQTIIQNQSQTFYFRWLPLRHDASSRTWTVQQKIVGVRILIQIGGNHIEYDSTARNPASSSNPLADFFKALIGSEFTLTLDQECRVVKIEGHKKFLEALVKANPAMEKLLKQILNEDALKQMADPAFAALPPRPVRPGESWGKRSLLSMGPIGTYDTTYTYTYKGKDKETTGEPLDRIGVSARLQYRAPDKKTAQALPFRIVDADLKTTESTGHVLFDPRRGRVSKSHMRLIMEGTLNIEIAKQTTSVRLAQAQETDVLMTDDDPTGPGVVRAPFRPRLLLLPRETNFPEKAVPAKAPATAVKPPTGKPSAAPAVQAQLIPDLNQVPAQAVAVLCVRGLERTRERLSALLRKTTPDLAAAAQAQLDDWHKSWLGGRKLQGLVTDGAAFVVLLEVPRPQTPSRAALLLRVANYEEFRDGLLLADERAALRKEPEGYEKVTLKTTGRVVYLVNRGAFAAVTFDRDSADLFASVYQGLGTRLARDKDAGHGLLGADLSAYVNLAALNRDRRDWGKEMAEAIGPFLDRSAALGLTDRPTADLARALLQGGAGRDGQSAVLSLDFEPEGIALRGRLTVAPQSPAGRLLATQKPSLVVDLHRLPAGYTTYSGLEIDRKTLKESLPLLAGMAGMAGMPVEGGEALTATLQRLADARKGGQFRATRAGGESIEVWPCGRQADAVAAVRPTSSCSRPSARARRFARKPSATAAST
jgi:hypothetical protein